MLRADRGAPAREGVAWRAGNVTGRRDDRPEVWQNVQLLLNVADFSVGEGDLQVLVHIDLFGTQIHDLLRVALDRPDLVDGDRKSTRLNSSHLGISYAGFCLKEDTKRTRLTAG